MKDELMQRVVTAMSYCAVNGISLSQALIIMHLGMHGESTINDIQACSGCDASNIAHRVRYLIGTGDVVVVRDSRPKKYNLSPQGGKLWDKLRAKQTS